MPSKTIIFVTGNKFKLAEAKEILGRASMAVIGHSTSIQELQIQDAETLVKDKALKAFEQLRHPLFVEHTGLKLEYLNGLPGGLTQSFWDALEADRFCEIFGTVARTRVVARTDVCYVDGRRFNLFCGEIEGRVAPVPKGDRSFQWDCIFIPDGYHLTFSELGEEKNEISMRRQALDKLAEFIKGQGEI
jgi:XTP/dITP diphosphohydrolase